MSKLITVKLSDIHSNPFRNLDDWPTLPDKVAEIRASYKDTGGFWDGYMQVRKANPGYEQAFGHHRLVAALEEWGPEHEVQVTLVDLTDEEMFKRMVHENSETYGQRFYYSVMQPIASLVKAYADGKVELDPPGKSVRGPQLQAPSFSTRETKGTKLYNATTVSKYLGWTVQGTRDGDLKASMRVLIALAALELIERKVLSRNNFVSLSVTGAKALVDQVQTAMRTADASASIDIKLRQADLDKATKEGNTTKAEKLTAEITTLEAATEKVIKRAGKSTGNAIAQELVQLDKREDAITQAGEPEPVKTAVVKSATQIAYDLTAKSDNLLRDTDSKWTKVLDATPRAKDALAEVLDNVAARAKLRAAELRL